MLEDNDEEEGVLRQSVTKEEKISSSGKRFDALGTLLRPPRRQVINEFLFSVYCCIVMTGGPAENCCLQLNSILRQSAQFDCGSIID